jgi:hypothetical protein
MSGVKAKLKDIQKHLKAEEYDEVIELGKQVLKEEKGATLNVYHASVPSTSSQTSPKQS